jgi:beta-lactamase class D
LVDESLKITTFEQIKFLENAYYTNNLPFKIEDINLLKEIMIDEKNENYTIRAKTGWEGNMAGMLDMLRQKMMFGFLLRI